MSCDAFEAEMCSRGLAAAEVSAVRATIHGEPLRVAAESLGCSHEGVRQRLQRAAAKLGVAVAVFVAVGDSTRAGRLSRYVRGGGAARGEWHASLTRPGQGTVKLTREEAALEAWADRILAEAGA